MTTGCLDFGSRLRQFLDNSSSAVTTTYLGQLEGWEDKRKEPVAEAIGPRPRLANLAPKVVPAVLPPSLSNGK